MKYELKQQCIYCRVTEYFTGRIYAISHGVCKSLLCRVEYAIDTSLNKSQFDSNLRELLKEYAEREENDEQN